jgi:hypothetical protein
LAAHPAIRRNFRIMSRIIAIIAVLFATTLAFVRPTLAAQAISDYVRTNVLPQTSQAALRGSLGALAATNGNLFFGGGESNRFTNSQIVFGGGVSNIFTNPIVLFGGGASNLFTNSLMFFGGGMSNRWTNPVVLFGGGASNLWTNSHLFFGGGRSNSWTNGNLFFTSGQSNTLTNLNAALDVLYAHLGAGQTNPGNVLAFGTNGRIYGTLATPAFANLTLSSVTGGGVLITTNSSSNYAFAVSAILSNLNNGIGTNLTNLGYGAVTGAVGLTFLRLSNSLSDVASVPRAQTNLNIPRIRAGTNVSISGTYNADGGTGQDIYINLNTTTNSAGIATNGGNAWNTSLANPNINTNFVTFASNTMTVDGTVGAGYGAKIVTIYGGNTTAALDSGGAHLVLDNSGIGQTKVVFKNSGTFLGGVRGDSDGNFSWHATGGQGHQFYHSLDTSVPSVNASSSGVHILGDAGVVSTNALDVRGSLNVYNGGSAQIFVEGVQVLGAQQAAIADIPDPSTATAEDCANKINEILTKLRAHGLIAP